MVAFHFQFAQQAAWGCDACRRSGLEKKRRCGWLGIKPSGVVWARRDVTASCCPKSLVTAESVGWLEQFLVRRQLGHVADERLDARAVEAFIVLQGELEKEQRAR